METHTAPRAAHPFVASDDVEGMPVRRPNGEKIGFIDRLMIERQTGRVAYAVLSFGGFLGMGEKHMPVPWRRLSYNSDLDAYELDLSESELDRAPCYDDYRDFDWGNREREIEVHRYHHAKPYWAM